MTDEPAANADAPVTASPFESAPEPGLGPASAPAPAPVAAKVAPPPSSADVRPHMPEYKGGELDSERGPGLGCFWFQIGLLVFLFVLIPVGINLAWPYELLAALLFALLALLLFVGMTVIFLLRLVAADRRSTGGRRRPLSSATKTVGELADDAARDPVAGPTWTKTVDQAEAERIARAAAIRATAAEKAAERAARRTVAPSRDLGPGPGPGSDAGSATVPGHGSDLGSGGAIDTGREPPANDPNGPPGSGAPGVRQ